MSRRIAYVFAAACATFAAPAGADPECFDNVCRMPEVLEMPQAPTVEERGVADAVPQAEQRSGPAPIRPQMRVDDLPRPALRPLPVRPVQQTPDKPARQIARQARRQSDVSGEPRALVNRPYAGAAQPPAGAPSVAPSQPNAGVVVVVPGLQHGEDGMALLQGRRDNYQPFGSQGYWPLGVYRPSRSAPTYVYVPDAKILTIDSND
jgi:hypothetical protein